MRAALPVLAVLALLLPVGPASAPPPAPDMAWLEQAYADLAARYPTFRDVGLRAVPEPHLAVLFEGPVPRDLGTLHAALPTVGYDISGAVPLTHGAIVPFMLLLAQQVPPGIRPGAWMLAPAACTMAHVLRDQLDRPYILTAGHCVSQVGQRVSLVAEGDIGHVVAFRNGGVGQDFALVAVDPQHAAKVSGSMVGWHGPVGVATEPHLGKVQHYGWGAATWQAHATRCREGVTLPQFWGVTSFGFVGHVLWGDSGSATNLAGTGRAVGINTHLGGLPDVALGTRTSYAIAQLSSMTGLQLRLQDGPAPLVLCNVLDG